MSYHTFLISDSDGLLLAVVSAPSELIARHKVQKELGEPAALIHAERIAPGFARDIRECIGSRVGQV